MEYTNAVKILPPELLAEVKKHFPGGMLFVPKEELDRKERASLVIQLVEQNVPIVEVAKLAEISTRHVRRLRQNHLRSRKVGADKI